MNGHNAEDHQQQHDGHHQELDVEHMLEARITHVLQNKAAQVHFTPAMREQTMQRLSSRPATSRLLVPLVSLATALVIVLFLAVSLLQPPRLRDATTATTAATHYVVSTSLNTPGELANGGHLVSLDPTDHHLVYEAAKEPGLMYTADLSNPAGSNVLAMRYARDVAWAPDGSGLVTTIYPAGVLEPLLALIRTGQYMDTLGHPALAASWSPASNQQITYITEDHGTAKLWSTPPQKEHQPELLKTLPISMLVQRLVWSQDGHNLALVATTGNTSSPQSLNQPGRAIYVMDMRTSSLQKLDLPENVIVGNIAWSPNGRYLTYEETNSQNQVLLRTLDVAKQQTLFTITPQHKLLGWNWSPDSNALVYSDGGALSAHVLHGAKILFTKTQATQIYPLWLSNGRILCMNVTNGVGKLTLLAQGKK